MYVSSVTKIEGGRPGLKAKVRQIRYLVERAKRDGAFRAKVAHLVAELPEKDHRGEIELLVDYTKGGIRYLRDPWSPGGIELFIDPRTTLAEIGQWESGKRRYRPSGDCDDHVLLASALLETAGYPTRYIVGGVPPDHYKHIWIEVHSPSTGWLPVELTKKDAPVGWDPSERFPLVETYKGGHSTMSGLGQISLTIPIPLGLGNLPPRVVARRRLRAYGRTLPPAYRPANALGGFDTPSLRPPSFHNTWQDTALYAGATPSDFFRATEIRAMLPEWSPLRHSTLLGYDAPGLDHALMDWDELAGFSRYFKKIRKVIKAPFSKIAEVGKKYLPEIVGVAGTIVGGPMLGITAMTTVGQIKASEEAEKIAVREAAAAKVVQDQQIAAQKAAHAAAVIEQNRTLAQQAQRAAATRAAAQKATSLPSSIYSTLPGPSYYQATQGFALPPGTPDQVAVMDQQPIPQQSGPPPAAGVPLAAVAIAGVPLLFMLLRGMRR